MSVEVDLGCLDQTVLIVLAPTGVHYGNQVAGTACYYSVAEGFLTPIEHDVPLAEPESALTPRLMKHFAEVNRCCGGFSEKDADLLDALFSEDEMTRGIRVDRSRVGRQSDGREESMEAWVYVLIDEWIARRDGFSALSCSDDAPRLREAILTWRNSD